MAQEKLSKPEFNAYLSGYRFSISDGPNSPGECPGIAGKVFPQLLQFTLALGRSLDKRTIPPLQDPEEFMRGRIKAGIGRAILRPEEKLVVGSHLFIPYVFPGVLRVQLRVGHLNTPGIKTLVCTALRNKQGWIDPDVEEMIQRETPTGIFGEIGSALGFSRFFADAARESLGKTPSTLFYFFNTPEEGERIFLTKNPLEQKEILKDFRQYFYPSTKKEVIIEKANRLFNDGSIREPPNVYVERMGRLRSYCGLIFEALPSF